MTSDLSGITQSRLRILESIIREYTGAIPLHRHLKNVFAANKSFGSTDRRFYNSYSHTYFRLGKSLTELPFEERLAVATVLTGEKEGAFTSELLGKYPALSAIADKKLPAGERMIELTQCYPKFNVDSLTQSDWKFSQGVSKHEFAESMCVQPYVWLRVDQGRKQFVVNDLVKNQVEFSEVDGVLRCLPNAPLDKMETYLNGFFEIQDYSSQVAGNLVPMDDGNRWWDCCSGAGGKTLQLADRNHQILLTVSDIRQTALDNLKERFKKHHFRKPEMFLCDLQVGIPAALNDRIFDGIVLDAPCSGSGTWARTAEMLSFFDVSKLPDFVKRQKEILQRVVKSIKPDGILVYITCSVFEEENEGVVKFAVEECGLSVVNQQLINGMNRGADTMFCAILKK